VATDLSGRIAFTGGENGDDVYTMNADGSELRRLTHRPGPEFDPSWSPDGTRIVYRDSRREINRNDEIYVMNADGSHQANISRESGRFGAGPGDVPLHPHARLVA
jgi:TolB protein